MFVLQPGSPVYTRRIPAVSPRSPRNARAWATSIIATLGYDPDTVALVVTELTTNVLRYAAGPAQVAIALVEGHIEVSCSDRHPETASNVRAADMDDETVTGRGLFILAMLALDGVHVDTDPRRKRVAVRLPIGGAS